MMNYVAELIPMNKAYNIASIIEAVKRFPIDTRKRVMFEYLVIKGKNDDLSFGKKASQTVCMGSRRK
jgi:23S rRNA (adenine2503-C2)-methyltransferase